MSVEITTCYRHPERRAGVQCQRCERPICPSCMISASVGFQCPECAHRYRQKVYSPATLLAGARPYLTYALIVASVTVWVGGLARAGSDAMASTALASQWGLIGGAVAAGEWWRIFTAGFLHGGLFHLGFNMYALWILGPLIERSLGRLAFGAVYLTSLVTGSLGVLLLTPGSLTVGASGAIFGLFGAAIVGQRAAGVNLRSSGLVFWLVLNLVFTFLIPGISIGGHLGGLTGGLVAGGLLFRPATSGRSGVVLTLILAGLAIVASLWLATNPLSQ